MPLTSACVMRSATGSSRHSSVAASAFSPLPRCASATSSRRSAASGTPVQHDVLDPLAQLGVDVVVGHQGAGVDDAHREPGADRVVEEHGVDRLAHRVVAPEGEGDVGDAAGDPGARQVVGDPLAGLDEVEAVAGVLLDARRHREAVRVEDDVLGREVRPRRRGSGRPARRSAGAAPGCRPGRPRRRPSRPRRRRTCAPRGRGRGRSSSPSFIEIELTIDLPWTHLSPASITSNFEESTITGTRLMSGSAAISLRKRSMAATPSIMPSSMLTSMTCAPLSTCCSATVSAVS